MTTRIALACLVAAAVGPVPAAASDLRMNWHPRPALTVRTADLDLTTAQGRATLDRRIHRAARAICTPTGLGLTPALEAQRMACIDATVRAARPARLAAIRDQAARSPAALASASRP
ncbi:MAG: UrcA family protein [Sphingomonadaceae bacterium]|uniref:UrcA family protein n=1 Tax=Thermaurantiacus sp. TaxID=2820283 RepID=UPI00298EFB8E|nr:UrcA family protein [Thermaurantiacus sp.]MCS6986166.1 UrcA family protein [Sphingomonadaceae bacterium]MDW8414608.1 UrcA family protein [Thermaurantiacus sp.]